MFPEATIVDSGANVKADDFWNWVIFRETEFFYSANVRVQGPGAALCARSPATKGWASQARKNQPYSFANLGGGFDQDCKVKLLS
jgi:hypothetical protein